MKKQTKNKKKQLLLTITSSLLVSFVLLLNIIPKPSVGAATISELQARSAQLQAEIRANEEKAEEYGEHAKTLQAKLNQLSIEIDNANKEIELTSVNISRLEAELKKAEAELERQKDLLRASMRALYKRGGVSTVELLIASDSFSQFINDQEYLERLKVGIQESTKNVIALKQQIQDQKNEQEELKNKQVIQRNLLASKRAEEKNLLDQTKGKEASYQAIAQAQRKALAEAEAQLNRLVSAGNFVSLGPVSRGDRVGRVGSTGFSTGSHLHFMVVRDGSTVNPRSGGNNLVYGLGWPLPNNDWSDISQEYGCVAPYHWYNTKCGAGKSFHTGLDIASGYGNPVVAAADGDIVFRGCQGGLGYVVVINHGGGLFTYYPHMITPSGQTNGYCG